jgi:hypothetical protein
LLVTANVVLNSPILVTLRMDSVRSSETSFLRTATRRNIPEDGILHIHLRENLKSHMDVEVCGLCLLRGIQACLETC